MPKPAAPFENRDRVSLSHLHLDHENPRHDPIADEDKIIAQLLKSEGVLAIARHLAANGMSPLDRIGVIEMPGNRDHYIVVEGNRRACALKLLRDPKKLPAGPARTEFEELSKIANVPDRISLVVFNDREAARPWMSLRHLGPQGGIGMKRWTTPQKTRFARGGTPDQLALAVLERAQQGGWLEPDQLAKIGITTVTRYLGNPTVRTALGLGDRKKLVFTHEPQEVDEALKRFLLDAVPDDNGDAAVNSRTDREERIEYGRSILSRGFAPKTRLAAASTPPAPAPLSVVRKGRNPRNPDDRPQVIPSDFIVKNSDRILLRLVKELRDLRPDEGFPFSANYVLRAVIERILYLYAKKNGKFQSGMTDSKLTLICVELLQADGVQERQLKSMRRAGSDRDAHHSLDTLGNAVHGGHIPLRRELVRIWENWEPFLKMMLERLP